MTAPTQPHKPSCAKRIRAEIVAAGGTAKEAARAIADHCGVSPLRAHRLARGQTLDEAAAGMRLLAGSAPSAPKVERNQLGWWETGTRAPRLPTLELLCRYYEATPLELGLGELDVTVAEPSSAIAVRPGTSDGFPSVRAAPIRSVSTLTALGGRPTGHWPVAARRRASWTCWRSDSS